MNTNLDTGMMGRKNETMAVVDSKARVFGVSNLRIIDSSSFRFTPPGHTQAATCKSSQCFENDQLADHCPDAHAEKLVKDVQASLAGM
jgi:hypothetical protein